MDYVKISIEQRHFKSSYSKNGQDWHVTTVVKIHSIKKIKKSQKEKTHGQNIANTMDFYFHYDFNKKRLNER